MSLEGGRNKVAENFSNMPEPNMTSQRDSFTETCVHLLKNGKKEQSTDFSGFTGVHWQGRDGQYRQKPSVNCMGVKYLIHSVNTYYNSGFVCCRSRGRVREHKRHTLECLDRFREEPEAFKGGERKNQFERPLFGRMQD